MTEFSARDAKIAIAIISIVGTIAIILLWGANTFGTFLSLMNFSSSNTGEYVFGFILVRLPMLLAILGAGVAFTNLRHSSWLLGISTLLWLLFTLLWWAADGENPPTSGIFGSVFQGVGAYIAFKAHENENRPTYRPSGEAGGDVPNDSA
jgi:peptidoglycan/LPS O-acetylase OafA/YrhL